jgi:TonB family protein
MAIKLLKERAKSKADARNTMFFGRLPQATVVAPELQCWKRREACVTANAARDRRGKRMFARGMFCLAILASSAAPAASEPKQPTSKWVVNFADAQCVATRNYGPEEQPLYLVLKAPPIGEVLQIGVVWKGAPRSAIQTGGEVLFDNGEPIMTNLVEFGHKSLGQRALLVNLPAATLAPMRAATSLRIRSRSSPPSPKLGSRLSTAPSTVDQTFALTQMSALLKMMDTCTADLRKVWNVYDSQLPGPLKQPPSGDLRNLFRAEDYPEAALVNDQMGAVSLVLLINEDGRVADCTVTQTSGVAALDMQSCALIRERGRFVPAVGQDGKPAKSSWLQRINWRLEM